MYMYIYLYLVISLRRAVSYVTGASHAAGWQRTQNGMNWTLVDWQTSSRTPFYLSGGSPLT